jgi:hypothetical protein
LLVASHGLAVAQTLTGPARTGGRDQSERLVATNRNQWSQSAGARGCPYGRARSASVRAFLGSLAAGALDGDSNCKLKIAGLWSAIERSVEAINGVWLAEQSSW